MYKKSFLLIAAIVSFIWVGNVQAAATKSLLENDLFSVSFPTEKDGWACGRDGSILHTADGGATWDRQNSGTDYTLTSIFFTDAKNGWAVGNGGTIIHTADGGAKWSIQKSPVKFFLMSVFFTDAKTGWIVTQKTHILHTEDGGDTWTVQFSDPDSIYCLKSISFSDAKNGITVGEYGYMYRTDNGGKTWKKLAGKFSVNDYGDIDAGIFTFDVLSLTPTKAWAVGIDAYTVQTVDGGKTWRKSDTKFPNTHFFKIASDRKDTLVIVGRSVIFESYDAGKTFKIANAKPMVDYIWLYGVTPRGDKGFVAVGKKGTIYSGNFGPDKKLSWEEVKW